MAIVKVFPEDKEWSGGIDPYVSTSAGFFSSTHSRCGIRGNTYWQFVQTVPACDTPLTSLWAHSYIYMDMPAQGPIDNVTIMGLCQSGVASKAIDVRSSGNQYILNHVNGSTVTTLATEGGTSLAEMAVEMDIHIDSYGSTLSTIDVYKNGVLLLTYTGDISIPGVSGFNAIRSNCGANIYSQGIFPYHSQSIIADEDTRGMSVTTLSPNGAGDLNEWTGGYTNCDEITTVDSDYISSTISGQVFQCNVTGMTVSDVGIKAVIISARATCDIDSPIKSLELGIKSGSTASYTSAVSLSSAWNEYVYMISGLVNPVTSAPFTMAELQALQISIRSAT